MNSEPLEQPIEKKEKCANCETELHGPFCFHCGQHQKEHHLSFGTLSRDFLGEAFSFDSRFIKTIRLLIKEPGEITKQFLAGHRVAFIPPVKLYIFISFVYFLLAMMISPFSPVIQVNEDGKVIDGSSIITINPTTKPEKDPSEIIDGEDKDPKESGEVETFFEENMKKIVSEEGEILEDEVDKFKKIIGQNMPKMMFVLVPFFALLIKDLYRKSGFFYIEHLVFSLHFHSFAFLWMTLTLILKALLAYISILASKILGLMMGLWMLVYLYKAFRCVYPGGKWRTLYKETLLVFTYLFIFVLNLLAVSILSLYLL